MYLSEELEELIILVRRVGEKIMKIYNSDFSHSRKDDKTLITKADLLADSLLISGLKHYGYPFITEESREDPRRHQEKRVWIIDPIDGTSSFVKRKGEFAIQVALVEGGDPLLSVVYAPALGELYFAYKGKGAYLQEGELSPKKLFCEIKDSFEEATIMKSGHNSVEEVKEIIKSLGIKQESFRGSAGLKMGKIAQGEAHFYTAPTNKIHEWDMCAPQLILEEAGGFVYDLRGERITYNSKQTNLPYGVIATSVTNKKKILKVLESFKKKY